MHQKRYEGFLETPFLWKNKTIHSLEQFKIVPKPAKIDLEISKPLRLGKYVERFVAFELEQQPNISVLAENIQIQDGKCTIGELDCLLLKNNKPIHLEIIFKFYLYDATVGHSEIDHFIGPNRKDALVTKLNKLKNKQLPLLHSNTCKPYLEKLGLTPKTITQQVYFKAQLFVPFSQPDIELTDLNPDCIAGFYINFNELQQFKTCKFYIPQKPDWLLRPHSHVNWLNFSDFNMATSTYFEQQFSTLFWVKFYNGTLKKAFLVWW